jgi:hypothetical protein
MNAEGEREFLALTEKEIFEEARDRLQIAIDADTDNRNQAKYDLQFREGLNHWDVEGVTSASLQTPELTINLTDALVHRVVNNMKQQRPRGKSHPVGDGAQLEIADVINGIGRHVEYRSEASVAYDHAGEMAVTCGWGWWRLVSEYVAPDSFDQDIRILPIHNIFTVYADPSALMPTASDMNWCLVSIKMKRTEYKRLYPRMENVAWNDTGRDEWRIEWEDKEEIRLAEYFRIREKSEKLYLLQDSKGEESTRFKSDMPSEASLASAGLKVVDEREGSRREVQWFKLNGTRVVEREILPGSWIPIIRCQGNAAIIDGKVMRRGMVRAMIDPQRMVDYGEVAKIRRLGLTPQAPWVGAEGQFDGHDEWDNANRVPYAKLIYKPVTVQTDQGEVVLPPPQRQPPAQLEAGFAEFTNGMRANLLAVAGMPNDPGQDMTGQVVSGRAIQRRQNLSDQSHFQYYANQTLAIAHTWRIMLEWIPHYISTERMQRIIGEDGIPKTTMVNQRVQEDGVWKVKNDITVGRYDVVMDIGPGYETKREEGSEALINLVQNPALGQLVAKVGADLIFRSIDHPYMQELADRIAAATPEGLKGIMEQLPERARSIVQSMGAQIQQLQQTVQQLQLEQKFGLAKEHLKAVTKAHDTETMGRVKEFDTMARERGAQAREEIRAGTELLVKTLDHAHEKSMGEQLIERGEDGKQNGSSGQQ